MSQLQQIKQSLTALGQQARQTGAGLAQHSQQFRQQGQQVAQLIGGSAQSKDKQMMAALDHAANAVQQAQRALD